MVSDIYCVGLRDISANCVDLIRGFLGVWFRAAHACHTRSLVRQSQGDRRTRERVWHARSEEHTSELQSLRHLVCRLLLEKKKKQTNQAHIRFQDSETQRVK